MRSKEDIDMKVFLIGCGDIARHHGRAVVRLGGIKRDWNDELENVT